MTCTGQGPVTQLCMCTELPKKFQFCMNNEHSTSFVHDSQLQNDTPLQLQYNVFGANTLAI